MSVLTAAALAILPVFFRAEAASHDLYDNVVPADTADCLKKVRHAVVVGYFNIIHLQS